MNYIKMKGKVLEDVLQLSNNVSRCRLMVTSNTGKNGKLKNDFFDFVAFGDVSIRLANEVNINDEIEIIGHATNSSFSSQSGSIVHKIDFVIDEFKCSINSF